MKEVPFLYVHSNWNSVEGGRYFTIFFAPFEFWTVLSICCRLEHGGFRERQGWHVFWKQMLRWNLGYKMLIKDDHLWKERKDAGLGEAEVHLWYEPDKTLANLLGSSEAHIRVVPVWVEMAFIALPWSDVGCLRSGKDVTGGQVRLCAAEAVPDRADSLGTKSCFEGRFR